MADVMTPAQRSRCMSRIRGKNTKPEQLLRAALRAAGLRYRIHYKGPGRPDVVFVGARVVVFVDGCFWHGCPIHGVRPKTNAQFWSQKIDGNMRRDKSVNRQLKAEGWRVFRVWEHDVEGKLDRITRRLVRAVNSSAVKIGDKNVESRGGVRGASDR